MNDIVICNSIEIMSGIDCFRGWQSCLKPHFGMQNVHSELVLIFIIKEWLNRIK